MSTIREVLIDIAFLVTRLYIDFFTLTLTLTFRLPATLLRSFISLFKTPEYKTRKFRSVLVTGASVGIGAALAERFAGPGVIVTVTGRSEETLASTKDACEKKGAVCYTRAVDVRDKDAMVTLLREAHERKPLDLVIANAGCTPENDGIQEASLVLNTNVLGATHTVMPAIDLMMKEKNDPSYFPQVVIMSSLGGFTSSASFFMASYAASKNCLRTLGESLRTTLNGRIGVTMLYPGMTESRMVSRQISRGIKMITGVSRIESAVNLMESGIRRNAPEVGYPLAFYVIARAYGSSLSWLQDLCSPITRNYGDPYVVCDSEIWKNARLYKS